MNIKQKSARTQILELLEKKGDWYYGWLVTDVVGREVPHCTRVLDRLIEEGIVDTIIEWDGSTNCTLSDDYKLTLQIKRSLLTPTVTVL